MIEEKRRVEIESDNSTPHTHTHRHTLMQTLDHTHTNIKTHTHTHTHILILTSTSSYMVPTPVSLSLCLSAPLVFSSILWAVCVRWQTDTSRSLSMRFIFDMYIVGRYMLWYNFKLPRSTGLWFAIGRGEYLAGTLLLSYAVAEVRCATIT